MLRPRPSSPAARGWPRGHAPSPGFAPSSSRPRTSRPLVALLKWLTTVPPAVGLVQHPDGDHPSGEVGLGPPERGVRRGPEVDQQPVDRAASRTAPPEVRAPDARHRAETGQGGVAGEPVRRDAVAGADHPEQRGHDRHPARRPPPGVGGQTGQAEGVVEDPAVDLVGARRRRGGEVGVAGDQVGQPGGEAQGDAGPLGIRAAQLDERVQHLASGGAEGRGGEGSEVQRLAATGGRLALARRQQDQHRRQASRAPERGVDPG